MPCPVGTGTPPPLPKSANELDRFEVNFWCVQPCAGTLHVILIHREEPQLARLRIVRPLRQLLLPFARITLNRVMLPGASGSLIPRLRARLVTPRTERCFLILDQRLSQHAVAFVPLFNKNSGANRPRPRCLQAPYELRASFEFFRDKGTGMETSCVIATIAAATRRRICVSPSFF